jgi:hypothetical protein
MIRRDIGMYEQVPWWYGLSWHNMFTKKFACYPIGIHWVMKLGYWFLTDLCWHWRPTKFESLLMDQYRVGFHDGVDYATRINREDDS